MWWLSQLLQVRGRRSGQPLGAHCHEGGRAAPQREHPEGGLLTNNRYDVWQCGQCLRELTTRSIPRVSPPACTTLTCCGIRMWWRYPVYGDSYET